MRGTYFYGDTGTPDTNPPLTSRIGDFYIDYATGMLYVKS
jgi:hypothetical protein